MAVTDLLQGRIVQHESSVASSMDDLESLLQKSIADLLLMEMKLCKKDAQALVEMLRSYGQSFLFSR